MRGSGGGGGGTWYGLLPQCQPRQYQQYQPSRLGTQSQDKTSLAGPGCSALPAPPPLVKVGPSFHLIWDTALTVLY